MLENAQIESREGLYTSRLLTGDMKGQMLSSHLLPQIANAELGKTQDPASLIIGRT